MAREHASVAGMWRLSVLQYVPCFVPEIIAYSLSSVRPRIQTVLWVATLLVLCSAYSLTGSTVVSWLICFAVGIAIPLY